MEQLSGLDATFLAVESDTQPMHVLGVTVLAAPDAPDGGEPLDVEGLRRLVASRLELMPPLRRRVVTVPLGLDVPGWVDCRPDLDHHVQPATLARPGGRAELEAFLAEVAVPRLDLRRPPWRAWLVDGLEGGRQAFVAKVHHGAIDGLAALGLVAALFDLAPGAVPDDAGGAATLVTPEPPDVWSSLGRAAAGLARRPARWVDAGRHFVRSATRLGSRVHEGTSVTAPFTAPRISMNGPLDVRRAVALVTTPSETVAEVRAATGTTVNEVVLAVTAGALRSYLAARDELPERPLVVAVPTSLRARGEAAVSGNRVSALLSHLPVHVEDPVARLEHTVAATRDAKAVAEAVDPETIPRWTDLLPPAVTSGVVRGATATGLVEALPPVVNLVVSNVPGPPVPLFLGGARVEHAFATGPIFTPVGCNLTVLSYLSSIEWSLLVAPGRVPDLHLLARAVPAALEEVHAATR